MQWLIELRLVQITQTKIKKIENFSNLKANIFFVQFEARRSWEKLRRRISFTKPKPARQSAQSKDPQSAFPFQSFYDLAEDAKSASDHMNGHSFILRLLLWTLAYENLLRCDINWSKKLSQFHFCDILIENFSEFLCVVWFKS